MSYNLESLKNKQQLWEKELVKQLLIILKHEIEDEITHNSIQMKEEDKPLIADELRDVFGSLEKTLPEIVNVDLSDIEAVKKLQEYFGVTVVPVVLQEDIGVELGKIAEVYDRFSTNGYKPSFGTSYDSKPIYVFKNETKHIKLLSEEFKAAKSEFRKAMHEYLKSYNTVQPKSFSF